MLLVPIASELSIDEPVAMEKKCLNGAMRLPDGRFLREKKKECEGVNLRAEAQDWGSP